jgi:transposase
LNANPAKVVRGRKFEAARRLVGDERWSAVTQSATEGSWRQATLDNRALLSGIIYVFKSGIPWQVLPREFGCSGII